MTSKKVTFSPSTSRSIPLKMEYPFCKLLLREVQPGRHRTKNGKREIWCHFKQPAECPNSFHSLHNFDPKLSIESEQLNGMIDLFLSFSSSTEATFSNLSNAFEQLERNLKEVQKLQQQTLEAVAQAESSMTKPVINKIYQDDLKVFQEISREHNKELNSFKQQLFNFFEAEALQPKPVEVETKQLLEETKLVLETIQKQIMPLINPVHIEGDLS